MLGSAERGEQVPQGRDGQTGQVRAHARPGPVRVLGTARSVSDACHGPVGPMFITLMPQNAPQLHTAGCGEQTIRHECQREFLDSP